MIGYRCFFAKARPEWDFKYRSNASAFPFSSNAMLVMSFHGRNLFV